jgi:hypothetical protein
MLKTHIKKLIYKQKPQAIFKFIRMGVAYYYADLDEYRVFFQIPISDMGDTDFKATEDAKLLLRWLDVDDDSLGLSLPNNW